MNNDDFQYGDIVKHQSGAQGVLMAKAAGNMLGICIDGEDGLFNLRFEFAEECKVVATAKTVCDAFVAGLLKRDLFAM